MSHPVDIEVVVPAAAHLGEGPAWDDRDGVLLWVDILAGIVHRFDPMMGLDTSFAVGQPVGAVVPRRGPGLALAVRDGFALVDATGAIEVVAAVETDRPSNRMNDGKCDAAGRFWAGTMDEQRSRRGAGSLYRLDPSLKVTRMVDGVTISNGIAWSPDGTTLYYVDTPTCGVDAFDFDPRGGDIGNRREIIHIDSDDGHPDGLSVDAEGYLWVAMWGGWKVRRYSPDGRLDRSITLPVSLVTSCAFGGPRLTDLYVTSSQRGLTAVARREQPLAGSLFRIRSVAEGLPVNRFGG